MCGIERVNTHFIVNTADTGAFLLAMASKSMDSRQVEILLLVVYGNLKLFLIE